MLFDGGELTKREREKEEDIVCVGVPVGERATPPETAMKNPETKKNLAGFFFPRLACFFFLFTLMHPWESRHNRVHTRCIQRFKDSKK